MNRDTPLPLALEVYEGDVNRVKELLDDNKPINKRDYKGDFRGRNIPLDALSDMHNPGPG